MKFSDILTAVASLAVIMVLVSFPVEMVLVPALGVDWGPIVSSAISMFLSGLTGGIIFGRKMGGSRAEAAAKITVLAAVLMVFYVINLPSLGHWNKLVEEARPGATLTTSEWYVAESMMLGQIMFMYTIMVLVIGFIGLYAGSMLRRP